MRELVLYGLLPVSFFFILKSPFIGLILYTGVNIVRPEMLFWGGTQGAILFKLFFGLTLASFIINCRDGLDRAFSCRELWLMVWLYLALLISLFLSDHPVHARAYPLLNELLVLAVLGWILLVLLDSEKRILRYQEILLVQFAFLAIWAIEQHFRGNDRLEGIGGGAFGDSNAFAAALVLALPLALNMLQRGETKLRRVLAAGAAVALFLAVVFTQSRGGFLGLAVAVLAFVLLSQKKRGILLFLLSVLLVAVPYASEEYLDRLSTIKSEDGERDFSAGSRLVLWKAGLLVFLENPITGAGFLTFPAAKQKFEQKVETNDEKLREYSFSGYKVCHNTYVQLLSEGGLLAFIPYLWLILGSLLANYRLRRRSWAREDNGLVGLSVAIDAGIIGCCICNLFIDSVTSVFLPIQIFVSWCIRQQILKTLGTRSQVLS